MTPMAHSRAASSGGTAHLWRRQALPRPGHPGHPQDPATAAHAQPNAQPATPAPGVEYLAGDWRVSAADPATGATVTADYKVERPAGSAWLTGQALSAARSINARDVWGRDPLTHEIIRVVFDASGAFATVRAPGWDGARLVLEGEVRSPGGTVRVRESITRLGPDCFRAVWEAERDGKWTTYSVEEATRRS
jgi:hypothetical protein